MTKHLLILLFIVISCGGDKYDYIKEGQRFNKNSGEVEYKTQNGWILEEDFKKNQISNDTIIEEVKKTLHYINMASEMYFQSKGEITFDIELLENSGYLGIDSSIKEMWTFFSDANGSLFTAVSTDAFPEGSGIKILYNPENGEYLITK